LKEVVELLRRQGILVDVLTARSPVKVEVFTLDSIAVGPLFEGHRTVEAEGRWSSEPVDTTVTAGWYRVTTDQSLGTLAGYLLEPASEDGVVTWNLLDRELQPRGTYPIVRVRSSLPVPGVAVP
jgi:dipeptidyl-peptidase-4